MKLEEALWKLNKYGRQVTFLAEEDSEEYSIVVEDVFGDEYAKNFSSYGELIEYAENLEV